MTPVLIGKDLVSEGWSPNIEDKQVPGTYIELQIASLISTQTSANDAGQDCNFHILRSIPKPYGSNHLLRIVLEPKYYAFRRWLDTPSSSSDKVIGSLGKESSPPQKKGYSIYDPFDSKKPNHPIPNPRNLQRSDPLNGPRKNLRSS